MTIVRTPDKTKGVQGGFMGDNVCRAGSIYIHNVLVDGEGAAQQCAAELNGKTGKEYSVECHSENISDGLPARVMVTYCSVIEGKSRGQK